MDLSVGEAAPGGAATFAGIIHDLTERKRTAAPLFQAQKMEAVAPDYRVIALVKGRLRGDTSFLDAPYRKAELARCLRDVLDRVDC